MLHLRFPLSKLQAHLDRFYCPPSSPSQQSFPTTVPTMVSSLPVLTKRFEASARSLPAPEEFPWPPLVGEEKSVGKRVESMMKNASLLSTEFDVPSHGPRWQHKYPLGTIASLDEYVILLWQWCILSAGPLGPVPA